MAFSWGSFVGTFVSGSAWKRKHLKEVLLEMKILMHQAIGNPIFQMCNFRLEKKSVTCWLEGLDKAWGALV